MDFELSQQEIGKRIASLRKLKGLSQEELAKKIQLSRPSLVQIEGGRRNLSVLELHQLSLELGFSLDDFVSPDFSVNLPHTLSTNYPKAKEERVSVPTFQLEKFRNVLLYLLEKCAGKPNVGETVLYKLLYFADFNYYELYEEHLTGATYRKLPFGPVPHKLDSIIHEMIEAGALQRVKTQYHGYSQTRYLPLQKSDLQTLKASETEVLDHVIEQFGDWSAKAISDYSHQDLPWIASKEGEAINYELAFYREAPFSVRTYEEEREEG